MKLKELIDKLDTCEGQELTGFDFNIVRTELLEELDINHQIEGGWINPDNIDDRIKAYTIKAFTDSAFRGWSLTAVFIDKEYVFTEAYYNGRRYNYFFKDHQSLIKTREYLLSIAEKYQYNERCINYLGLEDMVSEKMKKTFRLTLK